MISDLFSAEKRLTRKQPVKKLGMKGLGLKIIIGNGLRNSGLPTVP